MSAHSELKGLDLHKPSRIPILNSLGRELLVDEWVALNAVENANGFIPVTRVANTNERVIGRVTDINIASGATGTVLVQDIINFNTASFTTGQSVAIVNTSGVFSFATTSDNTAAIGIINVANATGSIAINTITPLSASSSTTTLGQLTDVTLNTPAQGQTLTFGGTVWSNVGPRVFKGNLNIPTSGGTATTKPFLTQTPDIIDSSLFTLTGNNVEVNEAGVYSIGAIAHFGTAPSVGTVDVVIRINLFRSGGNSSIASSGSRNINTGGNNVIFFSNQASGLIELQANDRISVTAEYSNETSGATFSSSGSNEDLLTPSLGNNRLSIIKIK